MDKQIVKYDFIKGHNIKNTRSINVKKELKNIRENPLIPLISYLSESEEKYIIYQIQDDLTKHIQIYSFYFLSIERFLKSMSVARRYNNSCYWKRKSREKYNEQEKRLAEKYKKIRPYLELDFFNSLIYARILLDRTISLSRYFIKEQKTPSFTSFNNHKKFFTRLSTPYGTHDNYAVYLREKTNWFNEPLKMIRDKFLVHAGPKHLQIFGWHNTYELDLMVHPITPDKNGKREYLRFSIIQMIKDINEFLNWFCDYGLKSFKKPI